MKYMSKGILVAVVSGSQAVLAHPGHQHIVQSSNGLALNGLLIAVVVTGFLLGVRALQRRHTNP